MKLFLSEHKLHPPFFLPRRIQFLCCTDHDDVSVSVSTVKLTLKVASVLLYICRKFSFAIMLRMSAQHSAFKMLQKPNLPFWLLHSLIIKSREVKMLTLFEASYRCPMSPSQPLISQGNGLNGVCFILQVLSLFVLKAWGRFLDHSNRWCLKYDWINF